MPGVPIALVTALILAPAPAGAGVSAGRPRVALVASPARIELVPPGSRAIVLQNRGAERVVVDVAREALGRRPASKTWLAIRPERLVLRSGARAVFTIRVRRPRRANPGDHHIRVFVTTRPPRGARVPVRMRLGILVRVRVPGRIVRRLELRALRVRRSRSTRIVLVTLVNVGNVTEHLRDRVSAVLRRRGRMLARFRVRAQRALLPGARTALELRYLGRVRGSATAVVRVQLGRGLHPLVRRYRIRL